MGESAERMYALLVEANPIRDVDDPPAALVPARHLHLITSWRDTMQTQTRPPIQQTPGHPRKRLWKQALLGAAAVIAALAIALLSFDGRGPNDAEPEAQTAPSTSATPPTTVTAPEPAPPTPDYACTLLTLSDITAVGGAVATGGPTASASTDVCSFSDANAVERLVVKVYHQPSFTPGNYPGEEVDVGAFAVYSPEVKVIQVQLSNGDVLSIQDRGGFSEDQLRAGLIALAEIAVWNSTETASALPSQTDILPSA